MSPRCRTRHSLSSNVAKLACALAFLNAGVARAQGANPPNSINCGTNVSSPLWSKGAVFADSSVLETRSGQKVAAIWCVYLSTAAIPDPYSPQGGWSDAQLAAGFTLDPGIEWARITPTTAVDTRIRFHVAQVDTGQTEHFKISTTIEHLGASAWTEIAAHTIAASVRNDTVRFESAFVPMLASNMRWISAPLEFVRLDTGVVDPARAKEASAFVLSLRNQLGLSSRAGESVLYMYSRSGNGHKLLGFSTFPGAIDGFSSNTPMKFVFANVAAAGELYRHELARVALMASPRKLDAQLNEALASVLGGVGNNTWAEHVCTGRAAVLKFAGERDLPALFAKPDATATATVMLKIELPVFIEQMVVDGGNTALRKLISGNYDLTTRQAARASLAGVLGISFPTLMQRVSTRYSEKALAERCKN
ncbi:MAG: hypothetical protein ABI120_24460 [Gemmatimonadaceae bacterium]